MRTALREQGGADDEPGKHSHVLKSDLFSLNFKSKPSLGEVSERTQQVKVLWKFSELLEQC